MHIKTVAKYIRRSPYQAISALLITTLTFFVITCFAFLTILSVKLIDYLESRPQLTVFFSESAVPEDINSLKTQLEQTQKTVNVKYISKEEALQIYQQQNKSDPILLDLVTADVLPASLEIQTMRAEDLPSLLPIVRDASNIEEVVYQQDIVDKLIAWTNGLRIMGAAIISILVVVSIFVILTIIGIKITIRREEIEIMKLIGASNWFIRTPFLLEGMFYGFVGALVGWSLAYGILFLLTPQISSFLQGMPVFPISYILLLSVLGGELLTACLLGVFASYMAVLRYLK